MLQEKWLKRVFEHAKHVDEYLANEGGKYQRVFTALYGSQNYGLATEASDVDTRSVVVPTFETLALKGNSFKKELTLDNEKVVVLSFADLLAELRKGSPQAVELLDTQYVDVPVKFEKVYTRLVDRVYQLSHLAEAGYVRSVCGWLLSYLDQETEKAAARADYLYKHLQGYLVEAECDFPALGPCDKETLKSFLCLLKDKRYYGGNEGTDQYLQELYLKACRLV